MSVTHRVKSCHLLKTGWNWQVIQRRPDREMQINKHVLFFYKNPKRCNSNYQRAARSVYPRVRPERGINGCRIEQQ